MSPYSEINQSGKGGQEIFAENRLRNPQVRFGDPDRCHSNSEPDPTVGTSLPLNLTPPFIHTSSPYYTCS